MGKIIQGNFGGTFTSPAHKTCAIIAAGGKGERMGAGFNKIFLSVEDKPILAYTLDIFEDASEIDCVILVCSAQDLPLCKDVIEAFGYKKVKKIVQGGATRQESVRNGLDNVPADCELVVVHDAARPLIGKSDLKNVLDMAAQNGAAAVGTSPADTVKRVYGQEILETIDRNSLVLIGTPQAFNKTLLQNAHKIAKEKHQLVTDDCALLELMGEKITLVHGSKCNIKLTTPEDYALISAYLTCYRNEDYND